MNKLLIMCEGSDEKCIVDLLLNSGCLRFSPEDLLDLIPYHARQISTSGPVRTALNMYPGKVDVYRIGDTQTDRLIIPKDYKGKIGEVKKYCTKPELEMLFIISEGLVNEYEKVKSNTSPKEFSKSRIKLGDRKFNCTTKFFEDYWGRDTDLLVFAIKEYKRLHGKTHAKDEYCLADLLK